MSNQKLPLPSITDVLAFTQVFSAPDASTAVVKLGENASTLGGRAYQYLNSMDLHTAVPETGFVFVIMKDKFSVYTCTTFAVPY
nr:hypothetical protein CFP56_11583 [Quercus suber]